MFSDVFPLEGPGCQAAFEGAWLCLRMRIVLSSLGTLVEVQAKRERKRLANFDLLFDDVLGPLEPTCASFLRIF